ncbi:hypothetical protein MTR67_023220 [Solanum verrucosum]|uniref:Integrase zinc-binding domain-containing protein n=1 Tax=Solanum verrucosum TaxID=315347 RepID=A0AAF0QZB3_SOLVR|nr:hypothetical protein MTR67_023220 [Solanum verrucosum]
MGIRVDPRKMKVVKSWLRPLTPSDIRSFLGLAGYYRGFVEGFSSIVSPMTALTQNKVKFIWSEACEKSFQELKDRHTFALVLTLPKGTDGFVVYYDASRLGWDVCLCKMVRWLELLKDYDMSVLYRPDKANVVADALSRLFVGSVTHVDDDTKELVREVHRLARLGLDTILVELKEGVLRKSIKAISQGVDGVLRYQSHLCVPNIDDLRGQILSEAHSSRYSIHSRAIKMYHELREVYWWNGMKKYIMEFVAKCPKCQQVKVENQRPGGLSQDVGIPTWKWEEINVDFIVGLPCTQRQLDSIWVIIDRMTKLAHFIPVKVSYSAEDYAKLYIREIVKLYGVPSSNISNRGPQFTSHF